MSADRPDLVELRAAFRRLHDSGCFIIPNPWDAGTARYLRHLGYQALATTSAGFAFSLTASAFATSLMGQPFRSSMALLPPSPQSRAISGSRTWRQVARS